MYSNLPVYIYFVTGLSQISSFSSLMIELISKSLHIVEYISLKLTWTVIYYYRLPNVYLKHGIG